MTALARGTLEVAFNTSLLGRGSGYKWVRRMAHMGQPRQMPPASVAVRGSAAVQAAPGFAYCIKQHASAQLCSATPCRTRGPRSLAAAQPAAADDRPPSHQAAAPPGPARPPGRHACRPGTSSARSRMRTARAPRPDSAAHRAQYDRGWTVRVPPCRRASETAAAPRTRDAHAGADRGTAQRRP